VGGTKYYASQYITEDQENLLDEIARSIWAKIDNQGEQRGQKRRYEVDTEDSTITTANQSATLQYSHLDAQISTPADDNILGGGSLSEDRALEPTRNFSSIVMNDNSTGKEPSLRNVQLLDEIPTSSHPQTVPLQDQRYVPSSQPQDSLPHFREFSSKSPSFQERLQRPL
jgi:hypothetical protein